MTGKKTKRDDREKNNFGSKKKDKKRNHTKQDDDNIIIKIKVKLFNSILDLLNKSFIYFNPYHKPFLKLSLEKNKYKSIKKDINLKLLNTKLREIFYNDINSRNTTTVKKIYEEEKETNIIRILELTFGELLNVFRRTISIELQEKISHIKNISDNFKCLPYYLNEILEKNDNIESKENIKSYVDKFKDLCIDFENWFYKKRAKKTKNDK